MKTAYFDAPIQEFVLSDPDAILGALTRSHGFSLEQTQRDAWLEQIRILQMALPPTTKGHVLFEFAIPRMGKRADVVVLINNKVIVIEFKVGSDTFELSAINQVHDYALDLKNFHKGSHSAPIVPLLIATRATVSEPVALIWAEDMVAAPIKVSQSDLSLALATILSHDSSTDLDVRHWIRSGYQPTPTIVEAARALYQHHTVEDISRNDAGTQNLSITANRIFEIVKKSKATNRKSICLVTGVPGAGKTLAGLNIATKQAEAGPAERAVFLSGNGPLVTVLREALARDETKRLNCKKQEAARKVASFIQNIHHFRDDALRNSSPPYEHVVVFDEAQRAWNREQATKFMSAKRGHKDFNQSEPEFLLSVMDRHEDWCVVICLVGDGQEINTGEAGLPEWLEALKVKFLDWDIYTSDRLAEMTYKNLDLALENFSDSTLTKYSDLHLAVSMRSFRAESLSEFIAHLVDGDADRARATLEEFSQRYQVFVTRDFNQAKGWIKKKARGSERYGVLASSGARRLRPYGLNVGVKIDAPTWFLNDPNDVRSSFYCEETATEFDVQGLELDWACVGWDADFRHDGGGWAYHAFRGTNWQQVNADERKRYLKNAYRVILTRARQGMVVYVPLGAVSDRTSIPQYYDQTYAYLKACGIRDLQAAK